MGKARNTYRIVIGKSLGYSDNLEEW